MSVMAEFKKFAMRGNVVDLAVGVIIGAAFGAVVTSLVNDIIMPPIGLLLGGVDFSNLFIVLSHGAEAAASDPRPPAYLFEGPAEILVVSGEHAQLRWRRPVPDVWLRLDQLEPWSGS